jgi:hypothetical protein
MLTRGNVEARLEKSEETKDLSVDVFFYHEGPEVILNWLEKKKTGSDIA